MSTVATASPSGRQRLPASETLPCRTTSSRLVTQQLEPNVWRRRDFVSAKTTRSCIETSPSGRKTTSVRRSLLFVPAHDQVRVPSAHRRLHVDLVVHPRL